MNDFREYLVIKEKLKAKFWTIFAKIWYWLVILFTIVIVIESIWVETQISEYLIANSTRYNVGYILVPKIKC